MNNDQLQMSRENAIKFLRDISMGIDYLENAYSANRQVDTVEDNSLRVSMSDINSTMNAWHLMMHDKHSEMLHISGWNDWNSYSHCSWATHKW